MKVITRKEAKALKLTRYFTGKPCKHGHIAERYVSGIKCIVCKAGRDKARYEANPDYAKAHSKAYREANPELVKAGKKAWYEANPEYSKVYYEDHLEDIKAIKKAWYEANPEYSKTKSKAYREANPERVKASQKAWRESNPDYHKAWREDNSEHIKAKQQAYNKDNADKVNAKTASYRAQKLNATVPWANKEAIQAFYTEAALLTKETGIPYAVDHIVPLKGKNVCGLHVETNLQVITASENSKKHNKF